MASEGHKISKKINVPMGIFSRYGSDSSTDLSEEEADTKKWCPSCEVCIVCDQLLLPPFVKCLSDHGEICLDCAAVQGVCPQCDRIFIVMGEVSSDPENCQDAFNSHDQITTEAKSVEPEEIDINKNNILEAIKYLKVNHNNSKSGNKVFRHNAGDGVGKDLRFVVSEDEIRRKDRSNNMGNTSSKKLQNENRERHEVGTNISSTKFIHKMPQCLCQSTGNISNKQSNSSEDFKYHRSGKTNTINEEYNPLEDENHFKDYNQIFRKTSSLTFEHQDSKCVCKNQCQLKTINLKVLDSINICPVRFSIPACQWKGPKCLFERHIFLKHYPKQMDHNLTLMLELPDVKNMTIHKEVIHACNEIFILVWEKKSNMYMCSVYKVFHEDRDFEFYVSIQTSYSGLKYKCKCVSISYKERQYGYNKRFPYGLIPANLVMKCSNSKNALQYGLEMCSEPICSKIKERSQEGVKDKKYENLK